MRECGTYSGYRRHLRAGEPACPACKAACASFERERRRKKGTAPRQARVVAHGTYAEHVQHVKRGEKPCEACREALNQYRRSRRADPAVRARENHDNTVRGRAAWMLVARHREEFNALVAELKSDTEEAS